MKTIPQLKLENFLNDRGLLDYFINDCTYHGFDINALCDEQVLEYGRDSTMLYFLFRGKSLELDKKYCMLGREFNFIYNRISQDEIAIDKQWDNMWEE